VQKKKKGKKKKREEEGGIPNIPFWTLFLLSLELG
jgi:hypothetical protein